MHLLSHFETMSFHYFLKVKRQAIRVKTPLEEHFENINKSSDAEFWVPPPETAWQRRKRAEKKKKELLAKLLEDEKRKVWMDREKKYQLEARLARQNKKREEWLRSQRLKIAKAKKEELLEKIQKDVVQVLDSMINQL